MKALSIVELEQIAAELSGGANNRTANAAPQRRSQSPLAQTLAAATAAKLATLTQALSHISPDVPRGNGNILNPDGTPAPDYWFGVILAIRREFGAAGEASAREWSRQSPRFTKEGFDQAWGEFDPAHRNPVTVGSVYKLAMAYGWNAPAANSPSPNPPPCRFKLLDRSDIMAIQPIAWRVKGLLPQQGLAAVYGPSGSGKSFLAIDLGIRIASGQRWFGRRVSPCPVTYVMLEGEAGLRLRIAAWEAHNRATIPPGFKAIVQPCHLTDQNDVEDLAATLPTSGMVIVDTLNRATPGTDENSSKDMGEILAGLKRLQAATQGLVLIVHHTGKDASKGLRGHSSLHAALDGAIEVDRTATSRAWSAAKVKDGADGGAVGFKLHVVPLGQDADGDPVSSCAVGPDSAAIFAQKGPTGANQQAVLKAIRRAIHAAPQQNQCGSSPDAYRIRLDDAVSTAAESLTMTAKAKRRNVARTTIHSLVQGGHLRTGPDRGEDWLWLPSVSEIA